MPKGSNKTSKLIIKSWYKPRIKKVLMLYLEMAYYLYLSHLLQVCSIQLRTVTLFLYPKDGTYFGIETGRQLKTLVQDGLTLVL